VPYLDPIPKGIVISLGSVGAATIGIGLALNTAAPASPELLQNIALIGATLVLGYIVEAVWLVPRVEIGDEHEEWLGFITGAGMAGFMGVIFALLAAEYRAAGHEGLIGDLGLAWAAVSLIILGGTLVLQPLLADRYRDSGTGSRSAE